jgi:hypothetical protein
MLSPTSTRLTSHADTIRYLRESVESGLVAELLESAGDREFTPADAYVHPNGFWKLRIFGESLGQTQLRLHYWPTGSDHGDIHDHGWPYGSLALRGRGTEEIYHEASGDEVVAFSYHPATTDSFALGWQSEPTLIEHSETQIIEVGRFSGGEAEHIHRFYATPGSDLLTLVVTGEPVVAYSRVFLPADTAAIADITPTPLDLDQIRAILADARASLATVSDRV